MEKQQNKSPENSKTSKHKAWKIVGVVVAIIISAPFVFYGVAEFIYQQRVNTLSNETQRIWQDAGRSLGGVGFGSGVDVDCRNWLETLSDVGPCPAFVGTWAALLEPGKEANYLDSTLQKAGYTVGKGWIGGPLAEAGGAKGEFVVDLGATELNGKSAPYPAPTSKKWRLITASLFYAKY